MNWIEAIKKIREAQESNRLIIFVDAGVSKKTGLPSWGQLVDSIAQKSVMITVRYHDVQNNSYDFVVLSEKVFFNIPLETKFR